jgi:hypothetical protein
MKNGLTTGNKILLLAILGLGGLVSGLFYTPELINCDKPFIEISGSVGDAIGNAKGAYIATHPTSTPTPTATPKPTATPTPTPTPIPTATPTPPLEVIVGGEEVTSYLYEGNDIETFLREFTVEKLLGRKVILVDDYAEAKTFRKVLRFIIESALEYEIERR